MFHNLPAKLVVFFTCFVFFTTVFAQSIQLNLTSDKHTAYVGEPIQLSLDMNVVGEVVFVLPNEFEQLNIGRKTNQVFDVKQGKLVPNYSFLQRGAIDRAGEYVFKVTCKVNGKKYKAEPIVITVVEKPNLNEANATTTGEETNRL